MGNPEPNELIRPEQARTEPVNNADSSQEQIPDVNPTPAPVRDPS
jgi:hypothetical protein